MVFESHIEKLTQKYSEHLQTAIKDHADQESIKMILEEYREKCSTYHQHEVFYYKQIAESHGECVCNTNPETTDGPDEFCPMHGRRYPQIVDMLADTQAKINKIAEIANYWNALGGTMASGAIAADILKVVFPPPPPVIEASKPKFYFKDTEF